VLSCRRSRGLVSTGAAIAVCFAPEDDCAAFAVRAIDDAERQISWLALIAARSAPATLAH